MTTQLSPIEAHERTVGQIFSDTYAFEVPPYQRPYAWEEEHARELLSDLMDAMDNTATSGGVYFLGSIVLIKGPAEPRSLVVDGQQRLTTLTILLSVLRDLSDDSEMRIDRRTYVFQKANADKGTKERYRLLLREQDRAFFSKYVQQPDATSSTPDPKALEGSCQRIAENALYFRNALSTKSDAERNKLVAFIIQRCYLVVVAVPTADAARRIFTVLNARGMDLKPTDILKADMLQRAGSEREAPLAKRWEAIEQAVGRDRFAELFGHIRMIFEREKPRSALEVGFPKVVKPFNADADRFVSDTLEPIADALALLDDPAEVEVRFGTQAARAIRSLDRIDNKDWLPPALLRLWMRAQDDKVGVAKFLIELERLAYYLFVTRADVNERMARFALVMDGFDPRPDRPLVADGLALSGSERKAFMDALSGPLYRKSRVCKPVLQRLDEALSAGGASYDKLVSIEHVLPQTVNGGSEWAILFPDEDVREEWTHRLANLVFLTRRINTRASNWDFETKKARYFQSEGGTSPFPLTQSVLMADAWTLDHLQERQARMLSVLGKVWDLEVEAPA